MRRHIKYIILSLITFFAAVSCIEEMESPHVSGREQLTLVPRVTSFTNQYVTKAAYDFGEGDINRLAVLVFNNQGILVHFQESTSTATVTLNRSMFNHSGMTKSTIVMIANMDLSNITKGTAILSTTAANKTVTLSDMEDYVFDFGSNIFYTSVPDSGFPMIGGVSGVDLTTNGNDEIAVNLKVLFAKVSLEIAVENGTENTLNTTQFTISNATITNLAKATPLAIPAEVGAKPKDFLGNEKEDEDPSTSAGFTKTEFVDISSENKVRTITSTEKTVSAGSTSAKYTFYIAENRYNHAGAEGIYPDILWNNSDLYDNYKQQYKPKLASKQGGKGVPTYITLTGTYTDYRSTQWSVNYTVYLGKNNYDNFQIDRNSEYINTITIKGLRNNDDYGEGDVWFDHRVDVTGLKTQNSAANCVTITRETLIDSHIEVRPLRIKLNPNQYSAARLYAPNVNWVGVERFTGKNCQDGSVYCYKGNESIGKRKYFTTTLISELKGIVGDSGYITLMDGECAWIYFDENTGASDRTTDIIVEFFDTEGNSAGSETYTIIQRGLQTVGNHSIESYEEYLHTYDSADKYSLSTSPVDYTQQGFSWGLSGKKLSKDVLVSAAPLYGVEVLGQGINMQDVVRQRYDFLHSSDQPSGNTYYPYVKNGNTWNLVSFETGLNFTSRASANEKMTIMDMGTIPSSAYQYCLSKNKFKEDASGNHTMDIHWYLPDVNELKAILAANSSSADLSSDSYYWSSQPSYTGFGLDQLSDLADLLARIGVNLGNVDVKDEVTTSARAVAKSAVTDIARNENHRIRCLYSSTGIKNVDMSERAPDGMGGIFYFWMKGWTDGGKSTAGFFNYMLPSPSTTTGDTQKSDVPNVTFPTKANSQSADAEFPYIVTEGQNGTIEGFEKNPGDKSNWDEYNLRDGFYYTLRDYPGLSDYTLNKAAATNAYEETSTRKSITESSTMTSKVEKTQSLPSTFTLNPLNDKLTITFDQCDGDNVSVFTYDELYSQVKTSSTQYWNKPVYTGTNHQLKDATQSVTETGSGEADNINTTTKNEDDAKKNAFSRTTLGIQAGAYPEAVDNAKKNLKNKIDRINAEDPGWTYNESEISVPTLSWDSGEDNGVRYDTHKNIIGRWSATCYVTVTASVTIRKSGNVTLYVQASGGNWSTATTKTESSGPTVNTDQLRVYSGNSLTISVNAANANDYVISKVKVYISGGNRIKNVPVSSDLTTDNYYARFVDSALIPSKRGQIAYAEQGRFDYGSGEYIVLEGMEYSGDSTDSAVWQQWTGYNSSVTLVLADYKVATRAGFNAKYTYQTADTDKSKYIIIDRIEVKCTKKATASQ